MCECEDSMYMLKLCRWRIVRCEVSSVDCQLSRVDFVLNRVEWIATWPSRGWVQLSEAACHQNKLMPEQNNTWDGKTAHSLYETQEMVGQEQFGSQLSQGRWRFRFFFESILKGDKTSVPNLKKSFPRPYHPNNNICISNNKNPTISWIPLIRSSVM